MFSSPKQRQEHVDLLDGPWDNRFLLAISNLHRNTSQTVSSRVHVEVDEAAE